MDLPTIRLAGGDPQHPYAMLDQSPLSLKQDSAHADQDRLIGLIGVIKRRKAILIGAAVLGILLSLLATALAQRRYTATAQILALPRSTQVVTLDDQNLPSSFDTTFVDNSVEILKSTDLLARLADRLKLAQVPEFKVIEDDRSLLSLLNPLSWIPHQQDPAPELTGTVSDANPQQVAIIDQLRRQINVARVGNSQLIRISATSTSPKRAAALANVLVSLYLVDELDTKVEDVKRTNGWLDSQLAELKKNLEASEQAVETYRIKHNLLDAEGKSPTDQQRADITTQITLARADLAEKQARYDQTLSLVQSGGGLDTLAAALQSDVITRLRQQIADVASKQAELTSRYGDLHPSVINNKAQLRDLEGQVKAEIQRITTNLANEVGVAKSRLASLNATMQRLDQSAAGNGQAMVDLRELQRQVDSNQQLYTSMLEGQKKSFVLSNSDSAAPVARKTADAEVPVEPSYPVTAVFVAIGTLLSLVVGFALVFLLEMLDRGFRTADQVEQFLGLPHLSSVPIVSKKQLRDAGAETIIDYIAAVPTSVFAESLRKLRSGLVFSNVDNPPRSIMVTSSLPDEGKSTLACALAASLAASGYKTLLIDADLRNPSVARIMNATPTIGLPELLSGASTLNDVLNHHEATRLDVIYSVARPPNSADLLDSVAMAELLATARTRYNYIILDCPPALPIVDPLVLGRKVDACLFSVRWEQTPRDASQLAVRKLRGAEARIAGFALNVIDLVRMSRTSVAYSDENYYSSRYSKYYADNPGKA